MPGECNLLFPRLGIPQSYRPVLTPISKRLTIQTEHDAIAPPRRIQRDCMRLFSRCECPLLFQRLGIPQPHRPVPTPTGKRLAIWTERYAFDSRRTPGERDLRFTCLRVPQPHRIVKNQTGKRPAIRAKRYTCDLTCVPSEQHSLSICPCIIEPNTDGTDNGKPRPVRRIQNLLYIAFTKTRNRTFRQTPLCVVLGVSVRQK